MIEACTAVILAGGESKRMGQDKAGVMFQGKTLLQHAEENLMPLFQDIVVSCREKRSDTQLPQVLDAHIERAPMLGLAAALGVVQSDWVFLTGVDMPFISSDLLCFMAQQREGDEAVALCVDDMPQPLCCFYHRACAPALRRDLQQGRKSLKHFLKSLCVRWVFEEEARQYDAGLRSLVSLNTPADMKQWSES